MTVAVAFKAAIHWILRIRAIVELGNSYFFRLGQALIRKVTLRGGGSYT